jgi:hypothetical protein
VILFLDNDVRVGWDTLLARADACADRVTYRPTSGVSCRNGQFSGASLKTGRPDFYRRETEFGQCSNC